MYNTSEERRTKGSDNATIANESLKRKQPAKFFGKLLCRRARVLRGLEAEKRAKIKELVEESFNVLPIDNKVIKTYCNLYRSLKEKGLWIPDADLVIAATAVSNNMTLKTKDKHFERLERLGLKLAKHLSARALNLRTIQP